MSKSINTILKGAVMIYGDKADPYRCILDRYTNIKNELECMATTPRFNLIRIEFPEQRKEQIMHEIIELCVNKGII